MSPIGWGDLRKIALVGLVLAMPEPTWAAGRAALLLTASPDVILADAKSTTVLSATVLDSGGHNAPDGTTVVFTSTSGIFDRDSATTVSGIARATLTSSSVDGTATVTATAFVGGAGSSSATAHVEFTHDRSVVFSTPDSRWIQIDCPQELVYSADARMIECYGRKGSAHLRYKTLDLSANSFQVDLQSQTVIAHDVVLTRAKHVVTLALLRYDLISNSGSGVTPDNGSAPVKGVTVTGYDLDVAPQTEAASQQAVGTNLYEFVDLSGGKVMVSARAIFVDPGNQVQFRRATIYNGGVKVVSLAYHVMSLSSQEVFGQQVLGFGSQGLFLNVPYYYHVSPTDTGTIYLRNSAVNGAPISLEGYTPSNYGSHSAFSLDMVHTYSLHGGGNGTVTLSGLTRSDWGARFSHNQRFDDQTNSYLYVDTPAHHSLFLNSNINRQFKLFSLGLSFGGARDPGFNGFGSSSQTLSGYLSLNPLTLGRSGLNEATSLSTENGRYTSISPTSTVTTPVSTLALDTRFFTNPLHPDKKTVVDNSFTVGQSWDRLNGQHSLTLLGSLDINRVMPHNGTLNIGYTYRYDPLASQYSTLVPTSTTTTGGTTGTGGTGTTPTPTPIAYVTAASQHRVSVSYSFLPMRDITFSLLGGYGYPTKDMSFFSYVNYHINEDWGLGFSSQYNSYLSNNFAETDLTLSRRIFGRYLLFSYSTQTRKLRFDVAASGM